MNSDAKNLGFPLNDRLTLKIFEYLCYSDYIQLSLTSHSFYNIIKYNQYIFNKEAEHSFFGKEIYFFCEFADSEDFLRIRDEKIHKILEEKTEFWKCSFISYKKIKTEWITLFQLKSGETKVSHLYLDFIDNIFNILKEPNLPMLCLKRENVGTYGQTFFQNFLAEILYLGKTDYDFADNQNEWLENIFEKNEMFNKTQRKIFLKARWSMFQKQFLNYFEQDNQSSETKRKLSSEIFEESENSIYSSPITFPEIKENGSFLIQFYTIFFKTISLYTCVVYEYLKKQNNPYDLLNEYCIKWNIFVSTIIEYENIFKVFTKNMNEAYDQNFVDYPSYPKFSIWRMMTKIWIKNVYFRLEQALTVCFKKILKVIREKNLSFLMKDQAVPNKKEKINDPFNNLPLSLYISFKKRAKRYSSFKQMNFKSTEYENHAFFTRNLENYDSTNICSLLRAYINNVIDLSINEINVHYLGHSQLKFDPPYKPLEKLITTSFIDKFYKENYKIFFDNPSLYQPFLDADFELIFDIFPHKTKNEILMIKIEAWLDFFKEWCFNEIYSIPSKFKKITFDYIIDTKTYELLRDIVANQKNNESEYHLDMNLRISSGSSKMQEIDEDEENNEKSQYELAIEEEKLLKSQINFIAKSIDQRFGKSLIQKFYNDLNILNELRNTKTEIDMILEDINKTRDIPLILEENIQTFYNIGRDFNFSFLEEIYKQHNPVNKECSNMKSENDSFSERDTSLDSLNLLRQQSNFVQENDEEVKFQKFSSFQLKNNGDI